MSKKAEEIEEAFESKLSIDNKTPAELDEIEKQIQAKRIKTHLKEEENRIKKLRCPDCDVLLKLNPKEYMVEDKRPTMIECKKCGRLVTVSIKYNGPPETTDAVIKIKKGGYAWITTPPSNWSDEHAEKYYEEEKAKLLSGPGKSDLSLEGQKMLRVIMLIKK